MIELTKTVPPSAEQFAAAFRGMRNPMNSWEKSDSYIENGVYVVGAEDGRIAGQLRDAGGEHRKFMRQLPVTVDILAPLYWWKEFDTYKVGTTADSCSTMHKIHAKPFEMGDFSCEKLLGVDECPEHYMQLKMGECVSLLGAKELMCEFIIPMLNYYRGLYNKTKDKIYWEQMIQLLPSSYNQLRTVTLNYEVLYNQWRQRKGHKLEEWATYREWERTLPMARLLIGAGV